jgi:vacuolar-type H+-ATPase subunit F/Vma7
VNPGLLFGSSYNRCQIRDHASLDPIKDSSNRQVFGRQTNSSAAITGTCLFTAASAAVVGTDTLFVSELTVGDWIHRNTENRTYKVLSITDDTHLALTENYEGTTGSASAFEDTVTLSFLVTEADGDEIAHTMESETIDVRIPESYNLYTVPFMGLATGDGWIDLASDVVTAHNHDDRYYTETEIGAATGTTGASLMGLDATDVVGTTATEVQTALEEIARKGRYESKTIVTQDVIPDLTYTPRENASVVLFLGGVPQRNGTDYTVVAKAITWSYANSGIHVDPGDEVWVLYDSKD